MKRSKAILALVAAMALQTSISRASENRAVEVDIFGMGPAVDAAAMANVNAVLGQVVARGDAQKFIIYGYGFEGGYAACLEVPRYEKAETVDAIVAQLKAISPNPRTTSYSVRPVAECRKAE